MAIYKTGTFTLVSTAAAQNVALGFVPSLFLCSDITLASTSGRGAEVYWDINQQNLATPITVLTSWAGGTGTRSTATTNGVVPYQSTDPNLFTPQQLPYTSIAGNRAFIQQSTNLVITAITKAANANITATHSFTTADIGVTVVTFHGIVGMTQLNGLSGVITNVNSTTDFNVNIDTTNFGTYVAGVAGSTGGFANVITGAPVNTLYGNQSLPTSEQNLGTIGMTIGTDVFALANVANGHVWSYQAWLQSPATGP
jgi:hypothetical protein